MISHRVSLRCPLLVLSLLWFAIALSVALSGCANAEAAHVPTPTLSPKARLLLGTWIVTDGRLAKTEIRLGEKVEFRDDGTFIWEGREGRYSLYRDTTITLKRSAVGESFEYTFTVSDDSLILTRGTNCGKEDRYVLARAPVGDAAP